MSKYFNVVNWTEADLVNLPANETDEYEYKSSLIQNNKDYREKLKEKIQQAASAFWNSGGGYFIVGIEDKTGKIDGGIPPKMGKQSLRDWVDQITHEVEPVGQYKIQLIPPSSRSSLIQQGDIVLVIGFAESYNLPHMAPDHKYYIRAGAHTSPAKHFIVEALRARRGHNKPILRALMRRHPKKPDIVELIVTGINETVALNVVLDFEPRPLFLYGSEYVPLHIPLISNVMPFRTDMKLVGRSDLYGEQTVNLIMTYEDSNGNQFHQKEMLDDNRSILDRNLSIHRSDDPEKMIQNIAQDIRSFRMTFDHKLLPLILQYLDNNKDE